MVQMSKASIRKQYKKIREALPAKQVKKLSVVINKNLSQQEEYKQAKNIGSYYPINNEVIVGDDPNKKFYYPRITDEKLSFCSASTEFSINEFGIKEPVNSVDTELSKIDVFLLPLIAFNKSLYRIGYGGGYYDQTFSKLLHTNKKILLIGLGYEALKTDFNFQTNFDVRLDKIVTDKRIYV